MQPLLRTKITIPPSRARQVKRERLLTSLDEGTKRALTLVIAPAGFGKTSLAAAWAQLRRMPTAWLSLQEADRSGGQFFVYLIQALQTISPHIGQSSLILLENENQEGALFSLINDLAAEDRDMVLILDDYHLVNTAESNRILDFILENRPATFHLILAGRSLPDIHLSRLRALDQVVELGAGDLRFSSQEAAIFLEDIMQLRLSDEAREQLDRSTEGWPVGLQLAAIAQNRSDREGPKFSGQQYIFDYLADEVFKRESADVRDFLMITALFDRFCQPMIEAVYADYRHAEAGQAGGRVTELLSYVERSHLFLVQLDAVWYRYHALFSDFLRPMISVEQQKQWHHSASLWMEQNGLPVDAIHFALLAGDVERGVRLLQANYLEMLLQGDQTQIRQLLSELPPEEFDRNPRLWLAKGWTLVLSMDATHTSDCCTRAYESAIKLGVLDQIQGELLSQRMLSKIFSAQDSDLSEINEALKYLRHDEQFLVGLVHFSLGLHYVITGNTRGVVDTLQQALQLMDLSHNQLVAIFAQAQLGETLQVRGELDLAERVLQEAIRSIHETLGEHTLLAGLLYISYSDLLREQNRLEEAVHMAQQGVAYCQVWQPITSLDGMIVLSRIMAARHHWDEAYEILEKAFTLTRKSSSVMDDRVVAVQMVRLSLLAGDVGRARSYANQFLLNQPGDRKYYILWELVQLVIIRLRLAEGSDSAGYDTLLDELAQLQQIAEKNDRRSVLVEILLMQAQIHHQRHNHPLAADSLEKALRVCDACGYRRILLDEGPMLTNLLRTYRPQIHASHLYLEALLSQMAEENSPHPPSRREDTGLTPLTRREMEILAYLAGGKTNQEIAEACTLTLNTVKKHVANILAKLGVANRTQAVLLARRSGWVAEK